MRGRAQISLIVPFRAARTRRAPAIVAIRLNRTNYPDDLIFAVNLFVVSCLAESSSAESVTRKSLSTNMWVEAKFTPIPEENRVIFMFFFAVFQRQGGWVWAKQSFVPLSTFLLPMDWKCREVSCKLAQWWILFLSFQFVVMLSTMKHLFQDHVLRCKFSAVNCPNSGCEFKGVQSELVNHLRICPAQPVKCKRCQDTIPLNREHVSLLFTTCVNKSDWL